MDRHKNPKYPLRLNPSYKSHLESIAKEKGIPLSVLILECLQSQIPDSTKVNP